MTHWRVHAKRAWHRMDNPELRNARNLLRALREGDVDVVYISESTATYVGVDDGDPRHLGQAVSDLLQPRRMHLVAGPGYLSDMIAAYVHLLAAAPRLPVVVHPLWVRGTFAPWVQNPLYERKDAVAAVRALDPSTPTWRVRGSFPRNRDYASHEKIPYATYKGEDLVVGDYTRRLRALELRDPDRLELLYQYHYSGRPSPRGLAAVTELGRALNELGCRSVAYETPASVEFVAEVLGEQWRELHLENVKAVDDAYRAGRGPEGRILRTAWDFKPDEYVDAWDGVEHLNGAGRAHMAGLIAEAVNEELERA